MMSEHEYVRTYSFPWADCGGTADEIRYVLSREQLLYFARAMHRIGRDAIGEPSDDTYLGRCVDGLLNSVLHLPTIVGVSDGPPETP